jgi:hypothetical protein
MVPDLEFQGEMQLHTVKVIDEKEVADDQVAYCAQCCDDPSTDSWYTGAVSVGMETIAANVGEHQQRVARIHDAKLAWRAAHPDAAKPVTALRSGF